MPGRVRFRCCVVAAVLLAFAAPSRAEDATPADRAAVETCVAGRTAEERERCVGAIADPCLDKSEDPSTYGMADCSKREYLVWDERLNETYKKLMAELDAEQRKELRALQRAWISFSERKCGFFRVVQPDGSIMIPIMSYCTMREAGRQALFLQQMLEEGDSR